jgi:hypothetical protein
MPSLPVDGPPGEATLLTPAKLSQTVGFVSLGVAESLRDEARFREACDVYKYALGIFQDHPPSEYFSSISNEACVIENLLHIIGYASNEGRCKYMKSSVVRLLDEKTQCK